jgi:hypothetical protein
MSVLPETVIGQIEFCEAHWPVWNAAPAAIGLTGPQVVELKTATEAARLSFNAAIAARQASKAATTTQNANVGTMRGVAADLIRQIKAYAELQSNPAAVYAAAQIPEPAAPTPAAPPGKPTDFEVALNSDGSITLSWNSTNSAASTGAFFTVSRKLPGQGAFSGVGGAPGTTNENRRAFFVDTTIPTSAAGQGAQYIVQGFRGTRVGEASDAVVVQFGVDGGGGLSVRPASETATGTTTTTTTPKPAAA